MKWVKVLLESRGLLMQQHLYPTLWPPVKRKRKVVVVGYSLLRGTDGLTCRLDPAHRGLDKGYYWKTPQYSKAFWLLSFIGCTTGQQWNSKEKSKRNQRDISALRLVEGSGTQVVISSILLVTTNIINRNRQIHQVNMLLLRWCNWKKIGDFDSTLDTSRDAPFSEGKKSSSTGASRGCWSSFKLAWKGERDQTRLGT